MGITTFACFIVICALIYYIVKRKYSYWERKGVPFVKPSIPYGNLEQWYQVQQGELMQNFYNQLKGKGKFFGIYLFHEPIAVASDLDFVKNVMVKDFDYFNGRGRYTNLEDDPLSCHLLAISGKKWRELRTKVTPIFTPSKMKSLYSTVLNVADRLNSTMSTMCGDNGSDIELQDFLARFTTDVIGLCGFGIECNSLKNPDAESRKVWRTIFKPNRRRALKYMFAQSFQNVAKFFHLKILPVNISNFFINIVDDAFQYRETNNIKHNDFMDLLMKIKSSTIDKNGNEIDGITLNDISASALLLFFSGFETSATTMSYALYELALNQEIQTRARKEIQDVLAKHNGEFSYEAMLDMNYIYQIIQESLRKYPAGAILRRIANKVYDVPDTNFTLEVGTKIIIPVYALHHDPEYFPNPEIYDPDRFTPEMIKNRKALTYLPFGDGPRKCIGIRFAMMQTCVGLVTILSNYVVSVCSKTVVPLKFDAHNEILTASGGVNLRFNNLNKFAMKINNIKIEST